MSYLEDFSSALSQKQGLWAEVVSDHGLFRLLEWVMDDELSPDVKESASEESIIQLLELPDLEQLCYLYVSYKPEPFVLRHWYQYVSGIAIDEVACKFALLSPEFKTSFFRDKCFEIYEVNSPQKSAQALLLQKLAEDITWPSMAKSVASIVTGLQISIDPAADEDNVVAAYRFLCHYLPPVA